MAVFGTLEATGQKLRTMRVIFMGTPEFAVPSLQRLIDDGYDVAAVFTQPDKPAGRGKVVHQPPVKELALAHRIPCYQPAKIKTNEEVRSVFEELHPDACIVAAYGKILPLWLLAIPRLGCINVHASLLPKYRGAAPINWAIANGETSTGVTIMQMEAGMDTGAIWATRSLPIEAEETALELSSHLSKLGADLLAETLPVIASGRSHPIPQIETEATYAPILKRENGLIDWGLPAAQIANQVRGFQPWPGSYTMFRGGRLIVWRAHARGKPIATSEQPDKEPTVAPPSLGNPDQSATPGAFLSADRSGFNVLCGEGSVLHIEEIQIEGKRRIGAADFLNGVRLSAGDRIAE